MREVPRNVVAEAIGFPESPRWRNGLLWFSDVHEYVLRACDEQGRLVQCVPASGRPAGLGFMPDGRLLLATGESRCLYWVENNALRLASDLSARCSGLLNDMVVDGRGGAYIGDTGFNMAAGEAFRPGRLFLFRDGEQALVVCDEVSFPNGMAVTADGTTLLVAESLANRVSAFAIRADGRLGPRRTFCDLDGVPDGIALNWDGSLWIADFAKGRFVLVGPEGLVRDEIAAGAAHGIACGWGGAKRDTLYLCAATRQPNGQYSGSIRAVSPGGAGAGWPA